MQQQLYVHYIVFLFGHYTPFFIAVPVCTRTVRGFIWFNFTSFYKQTNIPRRIRLLGLEELGGLVQELEPPFTQQLTKVAQLDQDKGGGGLSLAERRISIGKGGDANVKEMDGGFKVVLPKSRTTIPRADGDEAQQAILEAIGIRARCAENPKGLWVVDVGGLWGDFGLGAVRLSKNAYLSTCLSTHCHSGTLYYDAYCPKN